MIQNSSKHHYSVVTSQGEIAIWDTKPQSESQVPNEYIIQEVKFKNLWREKVHVIPNAGHAVFMDKPVEFNIILEQFFREVF